MTAAGSASGADADGPGPVDTEAPDELCDPWADPLEACGATRVCSFVDMSCHDAIGMAGVDEPCSVVDVDAWIGTCAPGLVCVAQLDTDGRCAIPCQDERACGIDRVCRASIGLAPTAVCVLPCDPFVPDCAPGEACYVQPEEPTPQCALEGPGVELDPCSVPNDCAAQHHCTSAASHMIECPDPIGCCTPICDVEIGDCVGINPLCAPLGVPDAPNLGVCVGDV